MVFETGAHDLLAIVEILGADEADHGIHQHRAKVPGHAEEVLAAVQAL